MKTLAPLLLLLTFLSTAAWAQDEVDFRVQFKPDRKYSQIVSQTNEMRTSYTAPKMYMEKLKEKGLLGNKVKKTGSTMTSVVKTGSLGDSARFPLTIEFTHVSGDRAKYIPDGTMLYGSATAGTMPSLDSVTGTSFDEKNQKLFLKTIQSVFSQISYPARKVKLGESFSREIPLSIPIGEMKMDMIITTTYKLTKIKNGVAHFDISQVYSMAATITKYKVTATGKGKGFVDYDIANNFYLHYSVNSSMSMSMKTDVFDLSLKSISTSDQKAQIIPFKVVKD